MLRKIGFSLLCATSLLSSNVFAVTEHTFSQVANYEFTLPPNDPQIFTNAFFWTVEGKCTVISEVEDNPFSFTVLRKSGSLNGIPLEKGDSMDLILHPGDNLYISAVSGGRVEMINHGEKTIKASCTSK